jgi:hypothetical protein
MKKKQNLDPLGNALLGLLETPQVTNTSRTRHLLFALAFLMAFVSGGSVGFWYIHNKQMNVNCNFLVAPSQLPFRT